MYAEIELLLELNITFNFIRSAGRGYVVLKPDVAQQIKDFIYSPVSNVNCFFECLRQWNRMAWSTLFRPKKLPVLHFNCVDGANPIKITDMDVLRRCLRIGNAVSDEDIKLVASPSLFSLPLCSKKIIALFLLNEKTKSKF